MGCVGGGARQLNVDALGNVRVCISGAVAGNLVDESLTSVYERLCAGGARLKRGFFCSVVADDAGAERLLDAGASARALEAFCATHGDTVFQRVLDVAGGAVSWLAET